MTAIDLFHNDFDQFSRDIRGWDLDFKLLGKGPYRSKLQQLEEEDILVTKLFVSNKLEQRGGAPTDRWTFALLHPQSPEVFWRGQTFRKQVLLYGPGSELDAYSPPGFEVLTISIPTEIVEGWRQLFSLNRKEKLVIEPGLFSVNLESTWHIHTYADQLFDAAGNTHILKTLQESLEVELLNLLSCSNSFDNNLTRINKFRVFKNLIHYIDDNLTGQISLNDLCKISNLSPKTVQRLFKYYTDQTPKRYIKSRKLNEVRHDLINFDGNFEFISDVANKWGFWHLGQFARDYNSTFKELPSETIKRRKTFIVKQVLP